MPTSKNLKKAILYGAIAAETLIGSPAFAQEANTSVEDKNKTTITNEKDQYYKAFENMYSNALYIKYRADAGIFGNTPTPKEMVNKIKTTSAEYASRIVELKKNKGTKEELKETHRKQMSGVTLSDTGVYSYPYEKDGKKRLAEGELTGTATNFLELEQEEAQFNNFLNNHMKNKDGR